LLGLVKQQPHDERIISWVGFHQQGECHCPGKYFQRSIRGFSISRDNEHEPFKPPEKNQKGHAVAIAAIVTPGELEQIEKLPTKT